MSVVTRIITSADVSVPSSRRDVWAVLADVGAYPEWWPMSLRVRVLNECAEFEGSEIEVRPVMGRTFRIRIEEIEGSRAIRLRFFGGSLEGPGGFHLMREKGGGTRIRYEMDVFTRGLAIALLSQVAPLHWIHSFRMRSVLWALAARLKRLGKAADAEARLKDHGEEARKRTEEAADRAASAEVQRVAAADEDAARLRAEEEAAARMVADQVTARAVADEAEIRTGAGEGASAPSPATRASRLRSALGRIGQWFREPPGAPPPTAPEVAAPASPEAQPESNFEVARRYLDALSSLASKEEIGAYFAEDATQEEFPHRFLQAAVTRSRSEILEARSLGLARFASQRYDLTGATGGGSQVAMEVRFQGVVASTGLEVSAGQELEARLALFLKFADGRIVRERVYACYEPWSTPAERRTILDERLALAGQLTAAPSPGLRPSVASGTHFEQSRSYLDALNSRAGSEEIALFFTPDAIQEELPNRLSPAGVSRNLEEIKRARTRSLESPASAHYELMGATGFGSQVALEVLRTVPADEGAGQPPGARLAIFLTFRDGLIVRQRTYTCS